MASKESEGKCFTFLWKLENISYFLEKKGEMIESPAFVVDAIEQTKWTLGLYPRGESNGNYIGCFLFREVDSKGADKVEIKSELAAILKDGSIDSGGITKRAFLKGQGRGYPEFQKLKDLHISGGSTFLSQDTLRIRCRIWKIAGDMAQDVLCTAHTRVGVAKRSFVWNVKNFSTLEPVKKCSYQVKSIENNAPLLSIDLSLTGGLSSEGIIHFEVSLQDQTTKFSTLKLFLIDASGNRVECNQEEIWFNDPAQTKQLTFFYTAKKLLEKKSMYLAKDTLSLLWEWSFSKGVVSREIEDVHFGCACPESIISNTHQLNNDKTTLLNAMVENIKSLYDKHFISDVSLKTSTSVFPAHKFILSASSSVFEAMFSSGMKEKDSNCVNIEDLSDDTISRMLLYIYSTRVEDLTWESATHLYVAADKYAILSLKNLCSSYMKDNLSPSNACEALLLSDFHADDDMKSSVQDYILKHVKETVNSVEWKLLMETNAKLAAETVCFLFK